MADEDFRYKFGSPMPGLDSKVTTALQDNFRRAATEKYVQTQTGLLIPKSLLTAKGQLVGASAAGEPVAIPAAPGNGYGITSDTSQSGGVGWLLAPASRVHNSANISVPHNAFTALAMNSERYDNASIHDTATNNSRLTAPRAGVYAIWGGATFDLNSTGERQLRIRLNGTTYISAEFEAPNASNWIHMQASTQYKLSTGDYVELVAYQNSGAALNVLAQGNASPEFAMHYLGPG